MPRIRGLRSDAAPDQGAGIGVVEASALRPDDAVSLGLHETRDLGHLCLGNAPPVSEDRQHVAGVAVFRVGLGTLSPCVPERGQCFELALVSEGHLGVLVDRFRMKSHGVALLRAVRGLRGLAPDG